MSAPVSAPPHRDRSILFTAGGLVLLAGLVATFVASVVAAIRDHLAAATGMPTLAVSAHTGYLFPHANTDPDPFGHTLILVFIGVALIGAVVLLVAVAVRGGRTSEKLS